MKIRINDEIKLFLSKNIASKIKNFHIDKLYLNKNELQFQINIIIK